MDRLATQASLLVSLALLARWAASLQCAPARRSAAAVFDEKWSVWPIPKTAKFGGQEMLLSVCTAAASPAADRLRFLHRLCIGDAEEAHGRVGSSPRAHAIRYKTYLGAGLPDGGFRLLEVVVLNASEHLSLTTPSNYSLALSSKSGRLVASTVFGAIYGLETFSQLVKGGHFNFSEVEIYDEPNYAHRGVMIDTGRRFVPVAALEELFYAMQFNKLNVLHLHLSDWCRVAIESKKFPALTARLVGLQAGFYTQEEMKALIETARSHGIQIQPEFDLPGHAAGFAPLAESGMQFCDSHHYQLYGDPENKTIEVLKEFLSEILPLFPNELVHFGCDELRNVGQCTPANFAALETQVFQFVHTLGKRPVAWEESLYKAKSAQLYNVVNTWAHHSAQETAEKGYDAIENAGPFFYLNHVDYVKQWVNISTIAPSTESGIRGRANSAGRLLGGEVGDSISLFLQVSMWTDYYCYIEQCGTGGSSKPRAAALYDPKYNREFQQSILGVIFPRAIKGAGSFWRFDGSMAETSPEFKHYILAHNARMKSRGIQVCPNECSCDEMNQCGKPYIH